MGGSLLVPLAGIPVPVPLSGDNPTWESDRAASPAQRLAWTRRLDKEEKNKRYLFCISLYIINPIISPLSTPLPTPLPVIFASTLLDSTRPEVPRASHPGSLFLTEAQPQNAAGTDAPRGPTAPDWTIVRPPLTGAKTASGGPLHLELPSFNSQQAAPSLALPGALSSVPSTNTSPLAARPCRFAPPKNEPSRLNRSPPHLPRPPPARIHFLWPILFYMFPSRYGLCYPKRHHV